MSNYRLVSFDVRLLAVVFAGLLPLGAFAVEDRERPNILWVSCEDISAHLGCYGDTYAVTPNLDRLASQGVRLTHAFAPIGVCAPARSCLITGMYPPSIGTHHMRCTGTLPDHVKCFPEYLRQAGYYCSNNVKTDYNFKQGRQAWDASSRQAHWRNRAPGQPFFSVFNLTSCHESRIRLPEAEYRQRTAEFTAAERHDPDKVPLPPYHPDTPEVRKDWARYHDMITYMDKQAGEILAELEADGLAESTIVFFFSDHGAGMPRSKRWLYDSSTRVPMIVRVPQRFQEQVGIEHVTAVAGAAGEKVAKPTPGNDRFAHAGTTSDRLVSFVDFGPTVLSLAGVQIPDHVQGRAFAGAQAEEPREFVFGFRDRMDERYDMIRAVRDHRFKYIRNYLPLRPYFHDQYISYMYQMPTMQVWQRLADEQRLSGPAAVFMARRKPVEELYDTVADPHEIQNLADDPGYADVRDRMRARLDQWTRQIVDLGFLPEADLRQRFDDRAPFDAVRSDADSYPFERIRAAADLAGRPRAGDVPRLIELLGDEDPAVRYWAAVGLESLGHEDSSAVAALREVLDDPSASARVAAAGGLVACGVSEEAVLVLAAALEHGSEWVRLAAVNTLDRIDESARSVLPQLQAARADKSRYVAAVATHAVEQLTAAAADN